MIHLRRSHVTALFVLLAVAAPAVGDYAEGDHAGGSGSGAAAPGGTRTSTMQARAIAAACSTRARRHADAATTAAIRRYQVESNGVTVHTMLRRVARDRQLLAALRADRLGDAQLRANALLVRHVVRIRVLRGSRLLVDANPTSFDVAGPRRTLHRHNGRVLAVLQLSIQDVIGFIKLTHKLNHAQVVVRGSSGRAASSLVRIPDGLPPSGCVSINGAHYAVRSFSEMSLVGEPLTVSVLVRSRLV